MGLREEILQDAIGWADYVLSSTPSDKIRKAYGHDSNAARPQKPYLELRIPDHDNMVGHDEVSRREDPNGDPQVRVLGYRWDMLQVDGFGEGAASLLSTLRRSLKKPDVRRWLKNNGPMGIDQQGAVSDTSALVANDDERRATTEFRINYRFVTSWADASTGIAKKLELRGDSVLREYTTQDIADALDMDMTLG